MINDVAAQDFVLRGDNNVLFCIISWLNVRRKNDRKRIKTNQNALIAFADSQMLVIADLSNKNTNILWLAVRNI